MNTVARILGVATGSQYLLCQYSGGYASRCVDSVDEVTGPNEYFLRVPDSPDPHARMVVERRGGHVRPKYAHDYPMCDLNNRNFRWWVETVVPPTGVECLPLRACP